MILEVRSGGQTVTLAIEHPGPGGTVRARVADQAWRVVWTDPRPVVDEGQRTIEEELDGR